MYGIVNLTQNLKTAEELEEEDKSVKQAKLQELIRKGTPRDLQEANRLMKVLAGYDTGRRVDYRARAVEEVEKIRNKALLLDEMLDQIEPGRVGDNDIYSVCSFD